VERKKTKKKRRKKETGGKNPRKNQEIKNFKTPKKPKQK
jgi:hypothetical protein